MLNWRGTGEAIVNIIMVVGEGSFICRDCGHKFTSLLLEYNASIFCTPATSCPKCKSWNMEPIGKTKMNLFLIIPNKKRFMH